MEKERSDLEWIFNEITVDHPCEVGKHLSKIEREETGSTAGCSLTYGEVTFGTIAECFSAIQENYGGMPSGGVFYDLGSGTGKGWISAALLHPFDQVCGIEVLQNLYVSSLMLTEKYNELIELKHSEQPDQYSKRPIEIYKADFFMQNWSNADILFLNST